MSDIQINALDTKWDVLNDKKKMLTVGVTHGTVLMDITFLQNQQQQVGPESRAQPGVAAHPVM